MKTLLLALILSFSAFASRADLAIYNNKVITTKTGNGLVQRISVTGYAVLSLDTDDFALVNVYVARNRFNVLLPAYQYLNVSAGLTGTYDVLSLYPIGVGGLTGKGKQVTLDVGNPLQLWSIPKVFKISGSDAYQDTVENYVEEYKGAAVFDSVNTKAANISHLTVSQVVDLIRTKLTGQGYVEE